MTTDTKTDVAKIKDRISKLLAVAGNDASTPGEKANAMQMASALMRRYNLERDDIDDHNKPRDEFNTVKVNTLYSRLTPWESTLASFVGAYVVKSIFVISSKDGGNYGTRGSVGQATISFTGSGPDAEIAAETYKQLVEQLLRQCAKKYGTPVRGQGRSYAVGYVQGLFIAGRAAEKLEKEKAEVSRALIRTDMLARESKNYYMSKTDGRVVTTTKRVGVSNNGAYNAGIADGLQANVDPRRAAQGLLN